MPGTAKGIYDVGYYFLVASLSGNWNPEQHFEMRM